MGIVKVAGNVIPIFLTTLSFDIITRYKEFHVLERILK